MPRRTWTEEQLTQAVASSTHITDVLRKLNLCNSGNRANIKKYIEKFGIDTSHFETGTERQNRLNNALGKRRAASLDEILIKGSYYNRFHLKIRLFNAGLKKRVCELCGQNEMWQGKKISLILDHVNGDRTDNRIENLRIVCPNCGAALPTHAGRNIKRHKTIKSCPICGKEARSSNHTYCSPECAKKAGSKPRFEKRKVVRPPMEVLLRETKELGFVATGKKYGVTDNSVRKWVKRYKWETSFKMA